MLKHQAAHQRMRYVLACVNSATHIMTGPPRAKFRTDVLQIGDEAFEPFFIGKTYTISTKFR